MIEIEVVIMGKKKYKDIQVGDKFSYLTVKGFDCMKGDHKPYWRCECDCADHKMVSIYDHDLKSGKRISCGCVTQMTKEERRLTHCQQTFYDFCVEMGRQDILDLWDYELNTLTPRKVASHTKIKYYFKCSRGLHPSEAKSLIGISVAIENNWKFTMCKKCNSFAQYAIDAYGEDVLERYWDYDKNTVDPWQLAHCSLTVIYIKCLRTAYHGSYPTNTYDFLGDIRCPYCAGKKVHYMDSLGCKFPQVLDLWSDKNTKSPYEYLPKSASYAWFKCASGEHEYTRRRIYSATDSGFACPECAKDKHVSKLQKKVDAYLNEQYSFDIRHEHNCTILPRGEITRKPMPFDNEVVDLKLIIEVHGLQHYVVTSWAKSAADKHGIAPEEELKRLQDRDAYKMHYAFDSGYHYLVIPYWTENDESYKKLIDDKIKQIAQSP